MMRNRRLTVNCPVMTAKRLSDYLSNQSKYPPFNGDAASLLFGCEIEFIILPLIKSAEEYFTQSNAKRVFERLVNDAGFKWSTSDHFHISKDTESGFITVKPDFSFGVIEISLPPRKSAEQLATLLTEITDQLDSALRSEGFTRSAETSIYDSNFKYDLYSLPRHVEYLKHFVNQRHTRQSEYYFPDYPARVAAFQIHLNVGSADVFKYLPCLYEFEWMIPLLFSKPSKSNGKLFGCLRSWMIDQTLGDSYSLRTIPSSIPGTLEEYAELFNCTPIIFREDPFSPSKDYTFVRPRNIGTLEFRSASTPENVEDALTICAFRALQFLIAYKYSDSPIDPSRKYARLAWVNQIGPSPKKAYSSFERSVIRRLIDNVHLVPENWRKHLNPIIKKLRPL